MSNFYQRSWENRGNLMLSQIIENYFNITGRPIATMSVAEYLEFCKYSDCNTLHETPISESHISETLVNTTPKHQPAETKTVSKPTHQKKITEQTPVNALSMLRSVSG